MAIAQNDGSIILNTKVDLNGINKGIAGIKSSVNSTTKMLMGFAKTVGLALGVSAFINFSKESAEMARQQEANVQRLIDIYGTASQSIGDFIDANARALGMSRNAAASFSTVYGNLFSVWADQKTNAELTAEYLNMTAVVASKTGRTVEDVQERVRSGLLGNTEAIEDLGIFVNVKTIEMTEAFQRMADGRSWQQLTAYEQQQVRTLAILEQATSKYGNEVAQNANLIKAQYRAAYEDMQATWGQFVNVVLVPILKVATQVMNIITAGMRAIAGITGKTIENVDGVSASIDGATEKQNELTEAVKGTNKELNKTLASFDTAQVLSSSNSAGAGATSSAGGGGAIDTSGFGGSLNGSQYSEEIESTLATIMGVVGIALAAVGLILLMTGNIAWGVGFIIGGAAILGVAMASVKDKPIAKEVIGILSQIMGAVGGAMVAIGIILIMLGSTAVGVGLIVAGAVSLIGSVASLVGFNVADVENVLKTIMSIAGGAMLALGIMLCIFAGPSPLSIGLIVAGAASLATSVALNFDAVRTALQGEIGLITGIVSSALLVIGIILLITGAGVPLGLGLIAAGAAGLASVIAVNWDFIVEKVKSVWEKIKSFWNMYIAKYFTAEWWGNLGKTAINGLLRWVINGLNNLIDKVNSFGFALPEVLGGGRVGFNISKITIPQLAKGAKLPANKPFLAMVGDQKYGTNIEAPAELIKQMAKEAIAEMGVSGQVQKEEHYYIGETEVMALLYRLAKGGERLQGESLVTGGAY